MAANESDKASLVTVNESSKGVKSRTNSSSSQMKTLWNVQMVKKNSDHDFTSKQRSQLVSTLSRDSMFKPKSKYTITVIY